MTQYWLIGLTPTGEPVKAPFESKREARIWASEHKLTVTRFLTSYTNLPAYQSRDHLLLEAQQ